MSFSQTQDVTVQYYFKYSSNWTRHPINYKQCYIQLGSGGVGNFFVGVGKFGSSKFFMEYQPTSDKSGSRFSNTGYNPTIANDVWYKLTIRAVLNTPGIINGIIQIWINDKLVLDYSNIAYRGFDQNGVGIGSMEFTPVWGGMSGVTKPATEYFWVDGTTISTDSSGPSSDSSSGLKPPSNLKIL